MTPTLTTAGGTVWIECPDRPTGQDTYTLTDRAGVAVGSGTCTESTAYTVTDYSASDGDTWTLEIEGTDLTEIVVDRWLQGRSAGGASWTGFVTEIVITAGDQPEGEGDPEPDTAVITIDRPVGPEPATVWRPTTPITVPAVTTLGTIQVSIAHGTDTWTSAAEIVRSVLAFPLTVADLLNAYPQLASKRSLFASPSVWWGLCQAAGELIDQEIRVRGQRELLLLGDAQVRPALVKALRLVLAENGFYGPAEDQYPLESQKNYRERMVQACNSLFTEAAYRTDATETEAFVRTSLSTRRSSR